MWGFLLTWNHIQNETSFFLPAKICLFFKKQVTHKMGQNVLRKSSINFPNISTCSLPRHCKVISPPSNIFLDLLRLCESLWTRRSCSLCNHRGTKKLPVGLHGHRCYSRNCGWDTPTLPLSVHPLVTVSTLAIIMSGENSHADTPDNPWAINNAWLSVG